MESEYKKQCPKCGKDQFYAQQPSLRRAINNNSKCPTCLAIYSHQKKYDTLVGKKFGKWTLLRISVQKIRGATAYDCKCECGHEQMCVGSPLKQGSSTQCKKCANVSSGLKNRLPPFKYLWNRLVRSAECRDIHCNITYEQFIKFVELKQCHYCERTLNWYVSSKQGNSLACQIDRMDSNKGYVEDNCVVCCKFCNSIKNTFISYALMIKIGQLIKEDRESQLNSGEAAIAFISEAAGIKQPAISEQTNCIHSISKI